MIKTKLSLLSIAAVIASAESRVTIMPKSKVAGDVDPSRVTIMPKSKVAGDVDPSRVTIMPKSKVDAANVEGRLSCTSWDVTKIITSEGRSFDVDTLLHIGSVSMMFGNDGSTFNGNTGCNEYFGSSFIEEEFNNLFFYDERVTMVACEGKDYYEVERAFLNALVHINTFVLDDTIGSLILTDKFGMTAIELEPSSSTEACPEWGHIEDVIASPLPFPCPTPAPVESDDDEEGRVDIKITPWPDAGIFDCQPSELSGTSWGVTKITTIDGTTLDVESLVGVGSVYTNFGEDCIFHGNSGCNQYDGEFSTQDNKLIFVDADSTNIDCWGSGDLNEAQVEAAFWNAFNRVETYEIQKSALTLKDADGNTIITYESSDGGKPDDDEEGHVDIDFGVDPDDDEEGHVDIDFGVEPDDGEGGHVELLNRVEPGN